MCRFSKLLLFSFFFCKGGSDRLMKRASFSCCNFLCVVLAAAYLKYCRCRLSCLPFVWHFFFIVTHTHTHTHTQTHTHTHTHTHMHACRHTQTQTHDFFHHPIRTEITFCKILSFRGVHVDLPTTWEALLSDYSLHKWLQLSHETCSQPTHTVLNSQHLQKVLNSPYTNCSVPWNVNQKFKGKGREESQGLGSEQTLFSMSIHLGLKFDCSDDLFSRILLTRKWSQLCGQKPSLTKFENSSLLC